MLEWQNYKTYCITFSQEKTLELKKKLAKIHGEFSLHLA